MSGKKGYFLLGLILFISVVALSGTVTVFEQDTRLKRFQENELKSNLDTMRRAIDLYRYKYTVATPNPIMLQELEDSLAAAAEPASKVFRLLAAESFLRARIASGTTIPLGNISWKVVKNLVQNPSFENDIGATDPSEFFVGAWRGNATGNDDCPDAWELTSTGAFQKIDLSAFGATEIFVVSFWVKCTSPTDTAIGKLKFGPDAGPLSLEVTAVNKEWRRYYGTYLNSTPGIVKLEFEQTSTTAGDVVNFDGVMLEKWSPPANPPAGLTAVPSVWVASYALVPNIASLTLQQGNFVDLTTSDGTPASLSWWLEW